jgi:hypothetical protein
MNVTDLNPLKQGPVPHTQMPSHGTPVLTQTFQIAPQTQAPNIIWIQRKEVQINLIRDAMSTEPSFICLSKVMVNELPPGSPTRAPTERVAHFHSLLLHISQIPQQKFFLI